MPVRRYREKQIQDIPRTIEELIPFLTKTHAELLQEGATGITYSLGSSIDYGDYYGVLEICYHSDETPEEKKEKQRRARINAEREKQQYEQLRKKFEKE